MLATYLTGERVALRAVQLSDKDHAVAWFEGAFPVNSERAETYLKDELEGLTDRKVLLVIVRVGADEDEIVGGVRVQLHGRHSDVHVHMAPALADADELCGDAVRLLIPWLRDEGEHIAVTLGVAADQTHTIVAAESVGMERTARLREWHFRGGGRVDGLVYQAIHPRWQGQEPSHA